MTARTARANPRRVPSSGPGRLGFQAAALVAVTALTLGGLLGLPALVSRPDVARPTPTPFSYLVDPRPAPPLRLTSAGGQPFDLGSLRGETALVFFGYTHCPDVCPATIGVLGQVLERVGTGAVHPVFVTVDPERDTAEWLADYLRYLPAGFSALTGTPAEIREAADAWGVRYARVDEGDDPERYAMNHTATVYLVDGDGMLRAEFPFGTEAGASVDVVRELGGDTDTRPSQSAPAPTAPAPAPPSPAPTTTPTTGPPTAAPPSAAPTPSARPELSRVEVVSSAVWAGGSSPVILALYDERGRIDDPAAGVDIQVVDGSGAPVGSNVRAVAVQPPGLTAVSYVATIEVPAPGWWRLSVPVARAGFVRSGSPGVAVLEPGGTAALGAAAPAVRTPTLADVAEPRQITTDPMPDLRLYRTSTVDALAARAPFVLVVDSWRFRTSDVCGQAISLGRFMLDRWPGVPIIHLEPYAYDIVSETPVLQGTLVNPTIVPAADAWGIAAEPWGPVSMPWVFVIDGDGVVRAKYQGVIGSADIDVMLALLGSD
ncbi:MAG: redoxin domain-containing protein [Chloroflexi bacterium]|nr:redoxin domain-containing protein [Chloroflexota bacterium]